MIGEHVVELKIGDTVIDTWQKFRIEHDIMSPADSFDMTFGVPSLEMDTEPIIETLDAAADRLQRVELRVDGALRLTGYMDEVQGEEGTDGPSVRIIGKDIGGQAVKEPMPLGFNIIGLRLVEIIHLVLAKWNVLVVIGNEGNRKVLTTKTKSYTIQGDAAVHGNIEKLKAQKWWSKVKKVESYQIQTQEDAATQMEAALNHYNVLSQADTPLYAEGLVPSFGVNLSTTFTTAYYSEVQQRKLANELKVDPGQTRMDWLSKLLKTQNLMGWFAADGRYIVATPNYEQSPVFHVTRAVEIPGVKSSVRTPDMNNVESARRSKRPGSRYSSVTVFGRQKKEAIKAVARDAELEALGVDSPWYHVDHDIRDIEEAQRVAERMLVESRIKDTVYTATLTGLSQGPFLYAHDTVFDVWDDSPACRVYDQLYCARVVLNYDETTGPTTEVTLQPKGIIEVPS